MSARSGRSARIATLAALAAAAVAAVVLAAGLGSSAVGWSDLTAVLGGGGDSTTRQILLDVRLPRVLLALLVGAALSGAGATYQAILRNPLADPYVLGISGGAALGVVLLAGLGGSGALASPMARPLAAFAGAIATVALLFGLARLGGRTETTTLLLVGVVLNAFDSALILLVMSVSDATRFQEALFFLMGYFPASPPWSSVAVSALVIPMGLLALLALSHTFNVLSLGAEEASGLGVRVERATWAGVIAASLLIATSVAFAGIVGFVGLIVPHAVRSLVGPDHRWLLPGSILAGGAFLVLADAAARSALAPTEMPVGVLTALLGGPFFLVLLFRRIRGDA